MTALIGPDQKALLQSGRVDIGRAEWRTAKEADAPTVKAMRTARVQFRAFGTPEQKTAAMAQLMATRAAIDGSCGEHDLRIAGFSTDDVKRYGEAAQNLAAAICRDKVAA